MESRNEKGISDVYHVQVTQGRYKADNNENLITYQLLQKLNVNTVALASFACVNAFQNVNQYYNQLSLEIGSQVFYVYLPPSSYSFWDITDLIALIQAQLNAQLSGQNFQIQLTGNNNKFVQISNTNAFRFVYNTYEQRYNKLVQYMGFGNGSQSAFSNQNTTQIGQFPYNVQVSSSINLQIQNLAMNTEVIGVIAQIPIDKAITTMIQYQSSYYQQNRHIIQKSGNMAVQNLVIALLDDLGYKMAINDNQLSMTLIFEAYQKG